MYKIILHEHVYKYVVDKWELLMTIIVAARTELSPYHYHAKWHKTLSTIKYLRALHRISNICLSVLHRTIVLQNSHDKNAGWIMNKNEHL